MPLRTFGVIGAVTGGFLFSMFGIDLGFGELKITLEDLIAAFIGSLLLVLLWHLCSGNNAFEAGAA